MKQESTGETEDAEFPDLTVEWDDVEGLTEVAVNRLLQIPDGRVRYEVAQRLRARLPWVQAVSVTQIALQDPRGVTGAAQQVGVSRAYADRLIRNHGQPSSRRTDVEGIPSALYGWLLGTYEALADAADKRSRGTPARDEWDKLFVSALQHTTLQARLLEAGTRWMRKLPDSRRAQWRKRLDAALGDIADAELPPYLDSTQQGQVLIGHNRARMEYHQR